MTAHLVDAALIGGWLIALWATVHYWRHDPDRDRRRMISHLRKVYGEGEGT